MSNISQGNELTSAELAWVIAGAAGGGGGVNIETPVGTVNGSNITFTVSNTPKFIVVDGMVRFSTLGYTYAAPTITVDVLAPPMEYIRSIY